MTDIRKKLDDGDIAVAGIFCVYMSIIILCLVYGVCFHDEYELLRGHTAKSEVTGEDFGTVIARAKEMNGSCEYRACNETICDWYDNSNRECNNMSKGDWIAKVEKRIYKGTSLCSETPGKFAETGNPSQKEGAYCWCKAGKNWVNHLLLDSASYCTENGCAGNCAHGVLYSPKFRSALNSKIQKTK